MVLWVWVWVWVWVGGRWKFDFCGGEWAWWLLVWVEGNGRGDRRTEETHGWAGMEQKRGSSLSVLWVGWGECGERVVVRRGWGEIDGLPERRAEGPGHFLDRCRTRSWRCNRHCMCMHTHIHPKGPVSRGGRMPNSATRKRGRKGGVGPGCPFCLPI